MTFSFNLQKRLKSLEEQHKASITGCPNLDGMQVFYWQA